MGPAEIKIALDTARALASTLKEADKLPLYAQALDLYNKLLEATQEIATLQARVTELEAAAALRAKIRYAKNVVWLGEGDEDENGPFCPACWGHGEKLVHMTFVYGDRTFATCPVATCRLGVHLELRDRPPRNPPQRGGGGFVHDY